MLLFILAFALVIFFSYITFFQTPQNNVQPTSIASPVVQPTIPKVVPVAKNNVLESQTTTSYPAIEQPTSKESNATTLAEEKTTQKMEVKSLPSQKKENIEEVAKEPYYLKLEPTLKSNDLFSSGAELTLYNPEFLKEKQTQEIKEEVQEDIVPEPVVSITTKTPVKEEAKSPNIKISTSEIDTLTYLKDKFYATENIVFAIMLVEEYYNAQNYQESISWALTANEMDPRSDKSWYWFAKNKVKLGQKDDAIKAIEAFLSDNTSRRLKTLLKEIKGDN